MTVKIECEDGVWRVVLSPDFIISGFSSEESAGHWFADYFSSAVSKSGDQRNELMRAALIAADPRGKTS